MSITIDEVPGWFVAENRTMLTGLLAEYNIRTVLEIGTCWGLSAGWFAQRVEHVTCIDRWTPIPSAGVPPNVYDLFLHNMQELGVRDKIEVIRADSHDPKTLTLLPRKQYDLVYVDGDHTREGCKLDIQMYGPLAIHVLCGDDYTTIPPEVAGVIQAVDEALPHRQTLGKFWWVVK